MKMLLFTLLPLLPWLSLTTCEDVAIIGGQPISIEKAPYMALFRPVGESFHCGASIVSDQFLVTAAHCVVWFPKMEVIVGTDKALSGGQKCWIEKMVQHPEYEKPTPFDNDIAVIKLDTKLEFNARVQPIKLAEAELAIEDSAQFRIIGFGKTESSPVSNQLLSVHVPHVPRVNCSVFHPNITDAMICAGTRNKGGCFGDSGGPLVYGDKLIGVVNFGSQFCHVPTVFARISALRDFIDEVMSDNQ